jgi:hypothetical protein
MERVGLTNFVLWAIATLVFGLLLVGDVAAVVVTGLCAFAVAWWTRFWPEGLGVAAGLSGACFIAGLWSSGAGAGGTPFFITAGALFAATWVMWRVRLAAYVAVHEADEPASPPNSTSRPWRLVVGVVLAAAALLLVNVVLYVGYWFGHCGGDTTPQPSPGSEVANYCDVTASGLLGACLVLGPSLLVLCAGVALASLRRARPVLIAAVVGIVLTIALHVPGWIVPGGG